MRNTNLGPTPRYGADWDAIRRRLGCDTAPIGMRYGADWDAIRDNWRTTREVAKRRAARRKRMIWQLAIITGATMLMCIGLGVGLLLDL